MYYNIFFDNASDVTMKCDKNNKNHEIASELNRNQFQKRTNRRVPPPPPQLKILGAPAPGYLFWCPFYNENSPGEVSKVYIGNYRAIILFLLISHYITHHRINLLLNYMYSRFFCSYSCIHFNRFRFNV